MYTCPMHPGIPRAEPGRCPDCGLTLVAADGSALARASDRTPSAGDPLKTRFWISLIFTVPVLALAGPVRFIPADAFPEWVGYVPLAFGSAVFFYGGWLFFSGALAELRSRAPGRMTLVALALLALYLYGLSAVVRGADTLLWELSALATLMLLGQWLETKAVQAARAVLPDAAAHLPETAEIVRSRKAQVVAVSALIAGDMVLVQPGGVIPADGMVVVGSWTVD